MNELQSLEDAPLMPSSQLPCSNFTMQQLQSCIFESPPSMLESPELTSSSLFDVVPSSSSGCQLCSRDVAGVIGPFFPKCAHKFCEECVGSINSSINSVCPSCTEESARSALSALRLSPSNITDVMTDSGKTIPRLDFSIWASSGTVWDSKPSLPLDSTSSLDIISSDASGLFSPCQVPLCASCGEGSTASHYCGECKDLLCAPCVDAHLRVRITKDHHVTPVSTAIAPSSITTQAAIKLNGDSSETITAVEEYTKAPPPTVNSICPRHESRVIGVCEWCSASPVCTACISEHNGHKIMPLDDVRTCVATLCAQSMDEERKVDEALDAVNKMQERVESCCQSIGAEIRSVVQMHVVALEERKRELCALLEMIKASKLSSLKGQFDALAAHKSALKEMLSVNESLRNEEDLGRVKGAFDEIVKMHCIGRTVRQASENDAIKFIHPDPLLLTKMRQLGGLESGACSTTSTLMGEGYKRAVKDRLTTVTVQLRDACNQVCRVRGQNLTATVHDFTMTPLDVCISEKEAGVCVISYTPLREGRHILNIAIRGTSIKGCPTDVDVRRGRNYDELMTQGELFSFGREGSGDGELCRPWGICCDALGRILVADRSNNRIQIFDKDGHFITKFGSAGTRGGQFDRPAGITTNTLNQIIVADKDNHRVQVFDQDGNFITKFGERGRPVGMFNYPWGVATNGLNHIAVSDTRNHRVQIFTSMGQFIRKCGFDSAYFYKHLDSPRGLCYLPDGQLLITDFNNHRLAVLSASRSSPEMQCYGAEGDADGMFCRPQGVKIDAEGNVLVCDSRNNRVQILSGEDMRCVASFGGLPKTNGFQMPLELPTPFAVGGSTNAPPPMFTPQPPKPLLDRPTDVCVTPEGRIYVVDFGNNCIRVF